MKYMLYLALALILLYFSGCKSESNPTNTDDDHYEAAGLLLKNGNTVYMKIFEGKIDSTYNTKIVFNPGEETQVFKMVFLDDKGKEKSDPDDPDLNFGYVIDDTTIVNMLFDSSQNWSFRLKGLKSGSTFLELRLNHHDHPDFKTPKIPVIVN